MSYSHFPKNILYVVFSYCSTANIADWASFAWAAIVSAALFKILFFEYETIITPKKPKKQDNHIVIYEINKHKENYYLFEVSNSINPFTFSCEVNQQFQSNEINNNTSPESINNNPCIEFAVVIDYYSRQTFNTDSEATNWALAIFAGISQLYQSQANVSVSVENMVIWNTSDPYSSSNSTSDTAESEKWKFYLKGEQTSNYAPFPADLKKPVSESTVSPGNIEFEWSGSDVDAGDTLTYDIYVDTSNPPTNRIKANHTSSSINHPINNAGTYYWKIITKDNSGSNSDSGVSKFKVAN